MLPAATLRDYSGIWKLDRGASRFGFLPPPVLRIETIIHNEPQLHISTRQKDTNGDVTVERDLIIGGPPVPVTIHGRERLVRAFRDDGGLVIETRSEVSGNPRRIEDKFTLDETGESLTIHRMSEQPGGAVRQRLQLRRQAPR